MTGPGVVVRESTWLFPVLEAVHLLGLCLLGGAVLVVDLRMLGLTMRGEAAAHLSQQMKPWLNSALLVLILTGVLLFLSEAVKCYYNQSFWVKMIALPVALVFTFTIRDRFAKRGGDDGATAVRLVALASMMLWFTVAAAGRWIGFS
jgi:hypothetical protein